MFTKQQRYIAAGTISTTRKTSPAGIPMRQQLGFSVQVNDDRVRIALTKNTKKSRAKRGILADRQSNKLVDFTGLFNFLARDDNTRFSTFSLGESNICHCWVNPFWYNSDKSRHPQR